MRITGGLKGRLERMMVRHLRRRGWVVFWLDEAARNCTTVCWMDAYEQEQNPGRPVRIDPTPTVVHWKHHGLTPTKRYVRHSGQGWEQADDLNGPWTKA